MSAILNQPGVFKALPVAWSIQESEGGSQSVALVIEFLIREEWENGEWTSWAEYEDHTIRGYFYIVKRDGTVNAKQVESLAKSLGWTGDLRAVEGDPPDRLCQIVVKEEVYQGKTQVKVKWINPEDYTPGLMGVDAETVGGLQTRFGSLLRAAAASALKTSGPKPAAPGRAKPKPAPKGAATAAEPSGEGDAGFDNSIPF